MNAIRIVILTPTAFPKATGNAASAERWRRSLSEEGAEVKVVETDSTPARDLIRSLDSFGPQLIHANHISRAGARMLDPETARRYGSLPLAVTPAGTDINSYPGENAESEIVGAVCRKARLIVTQSEEMRRRLRELFPELQARIAYVPKAYCRLGNDRYDLRSASGCRTGEILFFMPAGVRPVKGNIECLLALEKAHAADRRIRAVFAGPPIDPSYAKRFEKEIERLRSIARWIQIPPQAMFSAYAKADVVVNFSASEGMANSLLEAVAAGRPVLASRIRGNSWLQNGGNGLRPCGLLFDPADPGDFVHKALQFTEPQFLESTAAAARLRASTLPNPSEEARNLLQIYRSALA